MHVLTIFVVRAKGWALELAQGLWVCLPFYMSSCLSTVSDMLIV